MVVTTLNVTTIITNIIIPLIAHCASKHLHTTD